MWPGYTLDSPRPYSWLLCPLGSYRELSQGFLVVWKNETNKEDVWKGKLKVNVSAFLLMGKNSIWLPMSLSFPKCRLVCDHSMSAVTWVNKTGMMYQELVPCIHGNDCDILVTSRICKKGTPGALRIAGFYHGRAKTYRMKLWTGEPSPAPHTPWAYTFQKARENAKL